MAEQYQRRGGRPQAKKDEFDSKLLDLARVTRVAAGGKKFSFRATVVVGDQKGKVGLGVAKGMDVAQAIEKATRKAKKNLLIVPIVNDTIPHDVEAKFEASRIILKPQRQGRGVVAGGPVRVICEKAGIKNLSGKFLSNTHNKLNNAFAVMAALRKLKMKKKREEVVVQNTAEAK